MSTPQLGIGLAALGRPAYINIGRLDVLPATRDVAAMRQQTHAVLDAAYAAGIRWVDTARSYGSAEQFLATWLATLSATDQQKSGLRISSKWGYAYVAEWRTETEVHEVKEHSLERFRAQWAETKAILGERVSLYQVHSLTIDSPLFEDPELLTALARLRDSGVRVGFSTSGARQAETIRRAAELEVGGSRLFSAVQSTWNCLEPSVGSALNEVAQAGWRVLLKETLANGRLAVRAPEPLEALAQAHGVGTDAVALAHALAQPWADVVLIGPASVTQLHSNLQAQRVQLGDSDLDVLASLQQEAGTYWGERARLPWE